MDRLSRIDVIKPALNVKTLSNGTLTTALLDTLIHNCFNFNQFKQILSRMISTGFIQDTYAASRIIKFSTDSSFVHIAYSHKIFSCIENPNGFTWNTMMRAYIQRSKPEDAIFLYKLMLKDSDCVDNYTYPLMVQACTLRLDEYEGREFHCHVMKRGFENDVYVQNTLINLYAVCGNMREARQLFDEGPVLDLVSWNSILAGYVQIGNVEEAMRIYSQLPKSSVIASNSMIVLLGRCGKVNEALQLFSEMREKDVISWTALISCYEQNKMYEGALKLFVQMLHYGCSLDEVVIVSFLSACANLLVVQTGRMAHGLIVRNGFDSYVNLQNALIHMYTSCGEVVAAEKLFKSSCCLDQISWNSMVSSYLSCGKLEEARKVFYDMPEKDVVSWTAMISGNLQCGQFSETLELFQQMLSKDVKPDETTLVSVISACTHLAALDQGKWLHAYIRKNGLVVNSILGATLIDMYMKCGCVDNALEVFTSMEEKGVSTWNVLVLGLAINGQGEKSFKMFERMKANQVVPNEITFVAVLGACRHMGLVDEGRNYFESMTQIYNIQPNSKHYGCMVDLLGRAGLLKEAEKLINSMPMEPEVATWGALLSACKIYGDNEIGPRVGRKLVELYPDHDGFHVLLSNMYASRGSWNDVLGIRGSMMRRGIVKTPGCSMIEANGAVHEFLAGDKSHPQIKDIEVMLDEMSKRLKVLGYVPSTKEVFFDIDEEKESSILRHSEKLAIAFGLIATISPIPIRILKNLQICSDCHVAAKLTSRAFNREIVIRDQHQFHHFKNGSCSCMDYW